MRNTSQVVTSHPSASERAFRKILVAVDSPENSGRAIELAIRLAAVNRADLSIVHIIPVAVPLISPMGFGVPVGLSIHDFEEERQTTRRLSRWLARLVDVAEERGVRATMDLVPANTSVTEEIKRRASEESVDLVVVGTNDTTGLEGLLRGSISSAIVKQADCPVLVVR